MRLVLKSLKMKRGKSLEPYIKKGSPSVNVLMLTFAYAIPAGPLAFMSCE
jgi:hypothetical protein